MNYENYFRLQLDGLHRRTLSTGLALSARWAWLVESQIVLVSEASNR